MPIRSEAWAEGTPAWVDLMTPDLEASKAFYADVFGWTYDDSSEEFGFYATARLGGEAVAGIGPTQGPESPSPAWTTYLAADDADAVLQKVAGAGGQVMMPTMAIGDFGAMAVAIDPTGALFGLWQSGSHTGVDVYNEHGSVVWNEAMVGDLAVGKAFYRDVFGYRYEPVEVGTPYETVLLGDAPVAGIGSIELAGPGAPPHWRTYFQVADAAATCRRVAELGGSVLSEPWETPFGTMAALKGPTGEVFLLNGRPPESS